MIVNQFGWNISRNYKVIANLVQWILPVATEALTINCQERKYLLANQFTIT
jgi:hypothetical protein